MKKRILAGTFIATLLPQGLSATHGATLLEALRNSRGFATDTVNYGRNFLSTRNVAIFGSAYYVGLPALARLQDWGHQLLERGKTKGYGIGKLSKLIAAIFSFPEWLRTKISGRTATNPVQNPIPAVNNEAIINRLTTAENKLTAVDIKATDFKNHLEILVEQHKNTAEKVGILSQQHSELNTLVNSDNYKNSIIEQTKKIIGENFSKIGHSHNEYAEAIHNHEAFKDVAENKNAIKALQDDLILLKNQNEEPSELTHSTIEKTQQTTDNPLVKQNIVLE